MKITKVADAPNAKSVLLIKGSLPIFNGVRP